MKKLFLIFILFLTQISALKAQFVTLPDQNLTWALMNIHPDCFDANEDLDTTCAALKTGSLDISYNNISDLTGIRYFKLINNLNCAANNLTSLPVLPNNLTILNCSNNQISTTPTYPSGLTYLDISGNTLTCLGILPNLLTDLYLPDSIYCLNNKPSSVVNFSHISGALYSDFQVCPQANCGGYVELNDPNFAYGLPCVLQVGQKYLLDTLCAALDTTFSSIGSSDPLFTVNLEGLQYFKSMTELSMCFYMNNVILVFPTLPNTIKKITNCNGTYPFLLNFEFPPNIEYASLYGCVFDTTNNDTTTYPFMPSSLKKLELDIFNHLIFSNDFPDSLEELKFRVFDNHTIPTLPSKLKNLSVYGWYGNGFQQPIFTIPNLPDSLESLLMHDVNVFSLPILPNTLKNLSFFISNSTSNLSCLPILPASLDTLRIPSSIYCLPNKPNITDFGIYWTTVNYANFPVCGVMPCNTTYGYVFDDVNSNGVRDLNENNLKNVQVSAQYSSNQVISDTTGFLMRSDAGNIDFQIQIPSCYTNTTPTSINHNVIVNQTDTIYFGLKANLTCTNLSVLANASAPRPGFPKQAFLTYKNTGTTSISNVKLKFLKPTLETFNSASVIPSQTVNDTLIWNLGTLTSGQTSQIIINTTLSTSAVLGDSVLLQAWIEPVDGFLSDNYVASKQVIVGSFDPNDKTVSPQVQLPAANQPFDYLIRFQNTGTFPAQFVIVKDTFHSNLDLSTFHMISASHPYRLEIINRVAHWTFENINLADSFSNEPASHGYIRFKVKPVANLPLGTQIPNSAAIYFDYNAPVITNTSIAKIDILNTIWDKKLTSKVSVFPNPTSGLLQIQVEGSKIGEMKLINNLGQIVYQEIVNQENTTLDLTNYPEGVYLLKGIGWSAKVLKE